MISLYISHYLLQDGCTPSLAKLLNGGLVKKKLLHGLIVIKGYLTKRFSEEVAPTSSPRFMGP